MHKLEGAKIEYHLIFIHTLFKAPVDSKLMTTIGMC